MLLVCEMLRVVNQPLRHLSKIMKNLILWSRVGDCPARVSLPIESTQLQSTTVEFIFSNFTAIMAEKAIVLNKRNVVEGPINTEYGVSRSADVI